MAEPSYVVDAYNLIHSVGRLQRIASGRGPGAATLALIDLVSRWLSVLPDPRRVTLVFDGARPRSAPISPPVPGLHLRYMLDEADQDLMRLLERRGRHALVSDDAELIAFAGRQGQEVIGPRAFFADLVDDLKLLGEQAERSRTLSREEVEFWLERFEDAPAPAASSAPTAPPREPALEPDEVRYWLAYFGEEPLADP